MKEFFKKYEITSHDVLIIACSGGSDSMFLLSEILKIHPKYSIIVVHFNHQLRLEESFRDQQFVENFCKINGLKIEIGTSDINKIATENKTGIEETARIERYKFLKKIKEKYKASFILTAHHLDDNIETFMFNLIRGTRLNGLTGIDELSQDILRPFLHITKREILHKCKEDQIKFIHDSSNNDDNYLRNNLRLNIIPKFVDINPNYSKAFDGIMSYFQELRVFLDENLKKYIIDDSYFEVETFDKMNQFEQKGLIAYIFKITNNGTIGLTQTNINEVIKYIFDKGNYTKKEIKNMKLLKKNGKVYF